MKTRIYHSPVRSIGREEQLFLHGDPPWWEFDYAPTPNTGPHQPDWQGDFESALAASDNLAPVDDRPPLYCSTHQVQRAVYGRDCRGRYWFSEACWYLVAGGAIATVALLIRCLRQG